MLFRGRRRDRYKKWFKEPEIVEPIGPTFRIEEKDLYQMDIEEDGVSVSVTLVCSCELPVNKVLSENFYCQHCDRACSYPDCAFCDGLDKIFELRFREKKQMARYDYRCPVCQHEYVEIRGMNDPQEKTQCDNCKVDLIRVFGAIGVSFTGTGFYTTDKKMK